MFWKASAPKLTAMGKTLCTSCLDGSSFTPSIHISWCHGMSLGTELVFALALLLHPAWVAEKLWEPYSQSTESTGSIEVQLSSGLLFFSHIAHPTNPTLQPSILATTRPWAAGATATGDPPLIWQVGTRNLWRIMIFLMLCRGSALNLKTYEKLSKLHTPFRWIWREKCFKCLFKTRAVYS